MPRQISQQITINRAITDVFHALITPSQIKQWWSATIAEYKPPVRIHLTDYKYLSVEGGLPFEASMDTEFRLAIHNGSTLLTVIQSGFPDKPAADDFYQACVTGWIDTLQSIKRMLENR